MVINNIEANYQENLEVMKKYQVLQQVGELKLEDVMEKKIELIDKNWENNDMKFFGNTMDGEAVTHTIHKI